VSDQFEFEIPGAREADAEAAETRARIEREARERATRGEIELRRAQASQFGTIEGALFPASNLFTEGSK
jgi:hypothetical protein